MEFVTSFKPPLNRWNKNYISPGAVGSVGDVIGGTRLRQSTPEMSPRYQGWNSGFNSIFYGSNVQDGDSPSFMSDGLSARTITRPIARNDGYKTSVGWVAQDLVKEDRASEPILAGEPQFSWKTKQAQIYRAKVSGDAFLPLPGGYGPEGLTRGTQHPTLVVRSLGAATPQKPEHDNLQNIAEYLMTKSYFGDMREELGPFVKQRIRRV